MFYDKQMSDFHGFALELEYNDRKLMKNMKLNFKEAKYDMDIPV